MGVSGQHHVPAALYPGERIPGTHCTGGWVGLRAGLDTDARRKILCPCRGSNPGRPVRSQTTILTELRRLLNNNILIMYIIIIISLLIIIHRAYIASPQNRPLPNALTSLQRTGTAWEPSEPVKYRISPPPPPCNNFSVSRFLSFLFCRLICASKD
jgi:hypothetical protein